MGILSLPMSMLTATPPEQWGLEAAGGGSDWWLEEAGLTNGHESYDQLGVGYVGASHSGPADSLADVRVHAAHLICRRGDGRAVRDK